MSFCYINLETKIIFFFKSEKMHKSFLMKKCTSPSNEFLLHRWRNNFFFSFPNLKKKIFTSPANEFLLHRIEWKNEQVLLMSFSYKGIAKKCTSPFNEFLSHRKEWKNAQVHLMSFSYRQTDIHLPPSRLTLQSHHIYDMLAKLVENDVNNYFKQSTYFQRF